MFDVAPSEFLLVAIVALLVIGPKDLPKAMRIVGQWVGKARGMARHFRSGFDAMIRESELEEMEAKWKAENQRIMAEYAVTAPGSDTVAALPGLPSPPGTPSPPATPADDAGMKLNSETMPEIKA
jgi:sec-independent protein translocase protein TatB